MASGEESDRSAGNDSPSERHDRPSGVDVGTEILAAAVQELVHDEETGNQAGQEGGEEQGDSDSSYDVYDLIDAQLLRAPDDRAALVTDHRSNIMREATHRMTQWNPAMASDLLAGWRAPLDDLNELITAVAQHQVPIAELRTGELLHSGHLEGLLGGQDLSDAIMDMVAGLINSAPNHSLLVMPAQMAYLLQQGRPMTIAPALREHATSIAFFGNAGRHWTLYVANVQTRTLFFQDNMGDRAGRLGQPPQARVLWNG